MSAKTFRAAVVATAMGATLGSAAQAQQAALTFHRSELASPAGQAAVLQRIKRAAMSTCSAGRLMELGANRSCAAELTEQMVKSASSPALAALLEGRSDTKLATIAH